MKTWRGSRSHGFPPRHALFPPCHALFPPGAETGRCARVAAQAERRCALMHLGSRFALHLRLRNRSPCASARE
eukprot:1975577-Alexandrium_andersonii.AAC.1